MLSKFEKKLAFEFQMIEKSLYYIFCAIFMKKNNGMRMLFFYWKCEWECVYGLWWTDDGNHKRAAYLPILLAIHFFRSIALLKIQWEKNMRYTTNWPIGSGLFFSFIFSFLFPYMGYKQTIKYINTYMWNLVSMMMT